MCLCMCVFLFNMWELVKTAGCSLVIFEYVQPTMNINGVKKVIRL